MLYSLVDRQETSCSEFLSQHPVMSRVKTMGCNTVGDTTVRSMSVLYYSGTEESGTHKSDNEGMAFEQFLSLFCLSLSHLRSLLSLRQHSHNLRTRPAGHHVAMANLDNVASMSHYPGADSPSEGCRLDALERL